MKNTTKVYWLTIGLMVNVAAYMYVFVPKTNVNLLREPAFWYAAFVGNLLMFMLQGTLKQIDRDLGKKP